MAKSKKSPPVKLWLDSGAFSVWKAQLNGKPVRPIIMEELIDYIQETKHLLESYITFDVMPKGRGPDRSRSVVDEAAKASYEQQQVMKKAGLRPMPVFHQGEDFSWLERYIADGEDYIGLSGLKGLHSTKLVRDWCDYIFTYYTDDKGRPLVKFHGLGIMQPELLQRYPFYSVDSTSWALKGGYGSIHIPAIDPDGNPDFLKGATTVFLSGMKRKSGRQKMEYEGFITQQMDITGAPVRRWFEGQLGMSITEVRNLPDLRRKADLYYFEGLSKALHGVKLKEKHFKIGQRPLKVPAGLKAMKPWNLRIIYATNVCPRWSVMMNDVGAMNRLLSYYELREKPIEILEELVMLRGKFAAVEEHRPKANWGSAHKNFRTMKMAKRGEAELSEEEHGQAYD